METIAVAVGLFSLSQECIETATELYALRKRYKDAGILISAIYAESMVIAASLSQLQTLLQCNTLQDKPELHSTLDTALTACRVVYSCLHEEVHELAGKAETNDLKFMDKARWLWKEGNMRELLQQIRGQQAALGMLIQGLQMESIADIKTLVQENQASLRLIAGRSKSLRETHPKIRVPKSIYDHDPTTSISGTTDIQSALEQVEFVFDDEVVNSKAYRRAMALAEARTAKYVERGLSDSKNANMTTTPATPTSIPFEQFLTITRAAENLAEMRRQKEAAQEDHLGGHDELLSIIDSNYVPFMLPSPSPSPTPSQTSVYRIPENDNTKSQQSSRRSGNDTGYSDTVELPPSTAREEILSSAPEVTPSTAPEVVPSMAPKVAPSIMPEKQPSIVTETEPMALPEAVSSPTTGMIYEKPPPLPPRRVSTPPILVINNDDKSLPIPIRTEQRLSSEKDDNRFPIPVEDDNRLPIPLSSHPSMISVDLVSGNSSPSTLTLGSGRSGIQRKPLGVHAKPSSDILRSLSYDHETVTRVTSADNIAMHKVWQHLLNDENNFVDRVSKFRKIFHDAVVKEFPALEKHIDLIVATEEKILPIHQKQLVSKMKEQILKKKPYGTCDPGIFEDWAIQAQALYRSHFQRVPHAQSSINETLQKDPKFNPFLNNLGLSIVWFGKSWEDYLYLPITQLNSYIDALETLEPLTKKAPITSLRLQRTLGILQTLRKQGTDLMTEARKREQVQTLFRRIQTLDASLLDRLNMLDEGRRLNHRGRLAMRVNGAGPWQVVHLVLLDNFLFWGTLQVPKKAKETEKQKKKDKKDKKDSKDEINGSLWVLDPPIPVADLQVIEADKDENSIKTTMKDDLPRRTVLHQFFVKAGNIFGPAHAFGAFHFMERNMWMEKITVGISAASFKAEGTEILSAGMVESQYSFGV